MVMVMTIVQMGDTSYIPLILSHHDTVVQYHECNKIPEQCILAM